MALGSGWIQLGFVGDSFILVKSQSFDHHSPQAKHASNSFLICIEAVDNVIVSPSMVVVVKRFFIPMLAVAFYRTLLKPCLTSVRYIHVGLQDCLFLLDELPNYFM